MTLLASSDQWTAGRLIDELFLNLIDIKIHDKELGCIRKYRQQALYLLYRIPIYRPAPVFVIDTKDLSDRLKAELADLENESLDYIMKEAISRIFEEINERYFRLSARRSLRWKLV